MFFFWACKKDTIEQPVKPYECLDCAELSSLKTKHNYKQGFKVYDDIYLNKLQVVKLNNTDTNLSTYINFTEPGYYELYLKFTDSSQAVKDTTYQFVILDSERGETEWGLKTWTPAPFEENLNNLDALEIVYPKLIPETINTPYLVKLHVQDVLQKVYSRSSLNHISFNIKLGIGTVQAPPDLTNHNFSIAGNSINFTPSPTSIIPVEITDTIYNEKVLHSDTVYFMKKDLTVAMGASLIFQPNTTLLISEAANLYNFGSITINGTNSEPVYITCAASSKFWGGIISEGNNASINIKHAFICASGYHSSGEFSYGHAKRQALFRINNSNINLDHCYMLDHIGQIIYPTNSTIDFNNCVVQRAKSTGEISHSNATINNSYFSDFPNDSDLFQDEDNDALYLSNTDATITNSAFMYAKDDGLDTGSDEYGNILIENCHFEACFHEGLALASYEGQTKHHTIVNCTFMNCQQGLEMGFSSSMHTANVDNCLFTGNLIGIRYGDNYDWGPKRGIITIKNSKSINNIYKDVWNMSRITWTPKLENMIFTDTYVSMQSEQYPNLEIMN